MKIRNIVTVSEDLTHMLRRFPLAVLMVGLLTFGLLWLIHTNNDDYEYIVRYFGGPILAGYISVILYLIGEGRGRPVPLIVHIGILIAALAVTWFHEVLRFNVWMGIGAAVLYLGSAPFRKKPQNNDSAWDFTHRIWVGAIFATAGSILFALGILFINEAVRALFDVRLNGLLFDWVMPIGLAGLAPLYWLSTIDDPNSLSSEDSLRQPGFISRAVGFMGVWLLAPLVLVFAAILLAYLVQIILRGEIPNGETAALVTPFLIVGTLTWLVLDPAFIREKRIAKIFRSIWFWAMIPAATLLAVSVFLRIKDYGITPARYLLGLCVLWAILISLWAIIRIKERRDLRTIPSLAAMLLTLGSFGPLGAYGISSISQKARVNSVIDTADVITVDGVFKASEDLPTLTEEQINKLGGLTYLLTHNDEKWVRSKFAENDPLFAKEENFSRRYIARRAIDARFNGKAANMRIEYEIEGPTGPISLDGYDSVIGQVGNDYSFIPKSIGSSEYRVRVENDVLIISQDNQDIARLDLAVTFALTDDPSEAVEQMGNTPYDMEMIADVDYRLGIIFSKFEYSRLAKPAGSNRQNVERFNTDMIVLKGPKPAQD